jgi:hypothetical protein
MKSLLLSSVFVLFSLLQINSQCVVELNNDYTVDIEIEVVDILTSQSGPTCVVNFVLDYNVT